MGLLEYFSNCSLVACSASDVVWHFGHVMFHVQRSKLIAVYLHHLSVKTAEVPVTAIVE